MPNDQKDKNFVLNWKAYLSHHNPNKHPGYNFTDAEMRKIFIDGLHPELIVDGKKILNNMAFATMNHCVFPQQIPPHEPGGGGAHPNAGQLDNDAIALFLH